MTLTAVKIDKKPSIFNRLSPRYKSTRNPVEARLVTDRLTAVKTEKSISSIKALLILGGS